MAIRVGDPRETELPDIGLAIFEDSETGEQVLVDTSDPALRARVLTTNAAREEHISSAFRQAGVDAYSISTADELVPTLVRIARQRARRPRR